MGHSADGGDGDGGEDDKSCYCRSSSRVCTAWYPGDRNEDDARYSIVELGSATLYDFHEKNEEH